MEKKEKKEYIIPEVVEYGDVVALTRQAGSPNSDGLGNGTACESPFCSSPNDQQFFN